MTLNEVGRINLIELKRDPGKALDDFTAPSRWNMKLHKKIITQMREEFSRPSEAAADEAFLRNLHSILKAWYGKRAWLIIDYGEDFRHQVREAAALADELRTLRIETLQDGCKCPKHSEVPTGNNCNVDAMALVLWMVVSDFKITSGAARIVSGTKAIHHLLPDLLPPMDNAYTGNFFLGYNIGQGGEGAFRKLYLAFADLSQTFRGDKQLMKRVGEGYNTSLTKTLDHAIIGYMSARQ